MSQDATNTFTLQYVTTAGFPSKKICHLTHDYNLAHSGFFYLLDLVGDLVDIDTAVVRLLLVITVPALWTEQSEKITILIILSLYLTGDYICASVISR